MKALEHISEENLEDLLAYDDLFLDYFNAFLSLPAFPQPLYYNRLTGTFQEREGVVSHSIHGSVVLPETPPYGATDKEREHMLAWAKAERLPFFLNTELFREFKLCKLLLRQLEDGRMSGKSSQQQVRGYSRQSESYVSSLSNSADNSANEDSTDYEGEYVICGGIRRSALYPYERPGSRALSLPPKLGLGHVDSQDPSSSRSLHGADSKRTVSKNTSRSAGSKQTGRTSSKNQTVPPQTFDSGMGTSLMPSTREDMGPREITFTTRNDTVLDSINEDEIGPSVSRQVSAKSERSSKVVKSAKRRQSKTQNGGDVKQSKAENGKRANSAPQNYLDFLGMKNYSDYDAMYGEDEPEAGDMLVTFQEEFQDEQTTEIEVKTLEIKLNMSLQEMKEKMLGSVEKMAAFKRFLDDTSGKFAFSFWKDCEYYKDTTETWDETSGLISRNKLFRDIRDRYRMNLTKEARAQLAKASGSSNLSHTIFIRAQYDVLRRLRTYWLQRFILHQERTNKEIFLTPRSDYESITSEVPDLPQKSLVSRSQTVVSNTTFFPSISLVNSLPVRAEEVLHAARTCDWEFIRKSGRALDNRVKSAKVRFEPTTASSRTLRERLITALSTDRDAGGPFKQFLERTDPYLLANFLFWEDVTEYGQSEDRSADRLLRMGHAWLIFNRYLSLNSPYNIGLMPAERDKMYAVLLNTRDFVEAKLFQGAKNHATILLEKAWIRYLKEDLKTYIESRIRDTDDDVPTTADEIEVVVEKEQVIVRRRPWVARYPQSTDSERGQRLRTALSMAESIDEARRTEIRQKMRERRRIMEKERKKAVRAAKARQAELKKMKRKNVTFKKKEEQAEQDQYDDEDQNEEDSNRGYSPQYRESRNRSVRSEESDEKPADVPSEKKVTFSTMADNKGVISLFKKYMAENETRERMNLLNLYLDVDAYKSMGAKTDPKDKKKKDLQSNYIFKTYFESTARKKVHLSDKIYARLSVEKDRPRSPTLKETQNHLTPQLTELFDNFWKSQADEFGMDSKQMANMSQAEMALRSDNDTSLLKGWNKKKGGKNNKPDGRAQPTKEDKVEFLMMLTESCQGDMPIKMQYFLKYLVKHGEDDGFPMADKDLWFYMEVQRFRDCHHSFSDEQLLQRKVQSMLDTYLDASTQPSLQIDISSDIHQKTIRSCQRYLAGKDMSPGIFDEAQYLVFKELLPYWAGFSKSYKPPVDNARPMTKHEKDLKKRYELFESWEPPKKADFQLPTLPQRGAVCSVTFTMAKGIEYKEAGGFEEAGESLAATPVSGIAPMRVLNRSSSTLHLIPPTISELPPQQSRRRLSVIAAK
ncbi:unnamed protein product [Owenia fusiformis]|uniref:RGS domain-containing protein n=1 Tax=Owenia fusiformis TaxID=6347 RepID=A0A8S4PHG3_OWEFU|nr:unnamed protein product [Owenia fusiformis]